MKFVQRDADSSVRRQQHMPTLGNWPSNRINAKYQKAQTGKKKHVE
jgi:hypothetical protein